MKTLTINFTEDDLRAIIKDSLERDGYSVTNITFGEDRVPLAPGKPAPGVYAEVECKLLRR
jgi:hypothetical protein